MASTAGNLLIKDLKDAHTYFLQTMEGVTDEIAHFQPEGKANPISGLYAHLVFSEDFFLHFFLKRDQPLFETEWKDKTGFSEVQPTEWETAYPKWLKEVKVDMEKSKPYTQAVFETTEKYLDSLQDQDLEKMVDMSMFGMGERSAGEVILMMISGHAWSIMGEVSVIKGLQGLKGYPF